MYMFDITGDDIKSLNDEDLRILIGKLAEADLKQHKKEIAGIRYGGDQNAPDGGIDVYVEMHGEENDDAFVPRNITGFQVKVPNMAQAAIRDEMSPNGKLRDSIKAIIEKKGAYIIACSSDSVTQGLLLKRIDAMKNEISNCDNASEAKVDFYDRGKIAIWAMQYYEVVLWVRERIGKALSGWKYCKDWSSNPQAKDAVFYMDETPCMYMVGKSNEKFNILDGINKIRMELIKENSCVRLAGLSGTGKTRLLYALFDARIGENCLDEHNVIYCDIGENPNPSVLQMAENLVSTKQSVILAVDNCSPEEHEKLRKVCICTGSKVKLITVEYDVREDFPENTSAFYLEPTSNNSIINVLRAQKAYLSENDLQLIADFSNGNYRVALALASTVERGGELIGLTDEALFKRLFCQRNINNEDLLYAAEIISLVYSFDSTYDGEEFKTLAGLAELADIKQIKLYMYIAELEGRKLVQKRGKWKALLPHAIANRLAKRALEKIPIEILRNVFDIFKDTRISKSFCHRLSFLHDSENAVKISNSYLYRAIENKAAFSIYNDFWSYANILAPVSPKEYLTLIEKVIEICGIGAFENSYNTDFIRNIREIGYEIDFFERSVNLLVRLVSLENQNSKAAEDELASMFSLRFSGTEAGVERKIDVIKKLMDSEKNCEQILGEKMLAKALSARDYGVRMLVEFGARKRNYQGQFTVKEVTDYYKYILEYTVSLILINDTRSKKIKKILAEYEDHFFIDGLIDLYMEELDKILSNTDFVEGWVPCLHFLRLKGKDIDSKLKSQIETIKDKLQPKNLKQRIEAFAFAPRWGARDFSEYSEDDEAERKANDYVQKLGKELYLDTELLDILMPDLFSDSNNGARLFELGMGIAEASDNKVKDWNKLVSVYKNVNGIKDHAILSGYIKFITVYDNDVCEDILDEVCNDRKLEKEYLSLQMYACETEKTHARVLKAISHAGTNLFECSTLVAWWTGLYRDDEKFLEIVEAVKKRENTEQIVTHMLYRRMHQRKREKQDYVKIADYTMMYLSTCPYDNEFLKKEKASDEIGRIIELCIETERDYRDEVIKIYSWLFQKIYDGSIWPYYTSKLLKQLARKYGLELMDIFLPDGIELDYQIVECLGKRNSFSANVIQEIPEEVLEKWADCNPNERYLKLANFIIAYKNQDGELQWTKFALKILTKSIDIKAILECYFCSIWPTKCNGSQTKTMKQRITLYEYIIDNFDGEIKEWTGMKLEAYLQDIDRVAEREEKEEKEITERFE